MGNMPLMGRNQVFAGISLYLPFSVMKKIISTVHARYLERWVREHFRK